MLNDNHWTLERYKQRMTVQDWRKILLEERDTVVFRGQIRELKAKSIGFGVVEVYKAQLDHEWGEKTNGT